MKVTIITVCLNSQGTLKRCLDSIKKQDHKEIEQIIVDGGSKDRTHEIINDYKKYLNKIIIQKDKGIYDAMNKGLKNASGEIIGFLNSDDFYASSNVISFVVEQFLENNIELFAGDVAFFDRKNEKKTRRIFSSSIFSPEKIKYGIVPAHPSLFLHKKILKKVGLFNDSYKIAGDFEYILRIFKNKNLKYLYKKKILVRMQLGGISTRGIKSNILSNKEILRACKDNGIKTNIFNICLRYFYKIKEVINKK